MKGRERYLLPPARLYVRSFRSAKKNQKHNFRKHLTSHAPYVLYGVKYMDLVSLAFFFGSFVAITEELGVLLRAFPTVELQELHGART